MRLRLLERARLLLQLLVGGAQLFLLHLQFLVELLRFLQRVLQAMPIARRFERGAEHVTHRLEHLQVARFDVAQEAGFQHADQAALVLHRRQHHRARRGLAEARVHPQVVGRQLVEADRLAALRAFGDEGATFRNALTEALGFGRPAPGGDAGEAAARFGHVHGTDRQAHVLRQRLQRGASHAFDLLLAPEAFRQQRLAFAQPGLGLQRAGLALLLVERAAEGVRQAEQLAAAAPGDDRADGEHASQNHRQGDDEDAPSRPGSPTR